jgi:O-antigen ligase
MSGFSIATRIDRAGLARTADGLAVAVAVSLPWSTSATSILIVLWLLALAPTLAWADIRSQLMTAAGGLPVLLVLFGVLGVLWADVALLERWKGLDSFFKLLVIPLLFAQFRTSERGVWVFAGYLASCILLLAVSAVVTTIPSLSRALMHADNVVLKNAATQSGEFVTCIFGLLYLTVGAFEQRRWLLLTGMLLVNLGMLADMFFVATGRTALVVIPVLLVALAIKSLSSKGTVIIFAIAVALGVIGWNASPYLRDRTIQIWTDFQEYEAADGRNSSGERIEFWKKSVAFIRAAPLIGYGTGSIPSLFNATVIGKTGAAGSATTNPHNQTFAVAIQLGMLGAVVLWAMWIAHLLLFRGNGLPEWIGLIVVLQNIVGSLVNSHLFDFGQGWVYVFGVGVAGGVVFRLRAPRTAAGASTQSS